MESSQETMPVPGNGMTKKTSKDDGITVKVIPVPEMAKPKMPGAETSKTKMPGAEMTKKMSTEKTQMPKPKMEGKPLSSNGKTQGAESNARKMPPAGKMPQFEMTKPKVKIGQANPHVLELPGHNMTNAISERATKQVGPKTGFDYPATLRGSTSHFNVYYDPALGAGGQTIADGVIATCEGEYNYLQTQFGGISAGPFNIIIAAGVGGAYHWGCSATDLYCDADTSASPNIDHTRLLVVAEEVEVFSAAQNAGWNCGSSNGEGLSRILATELYPAALNGFNSAATWLDGGRPDFVNVNDPTDRSYVSTGCSVLFLNYLHYQLGYSWQQIVAAAASTLAQTYTILTGRTDGFTRFANLLQANFPAGTPCGLTNDNPFPLVDNTAPWSDWSSLGGWIDILNVSENADGRMEIFARGGDGAPYHMWQTAPSNGWSGWDSLAGWIDLISIGQNADGRLELFARGGDGAVWHKWQLWANGPWSGWDSLGGWIDILTVGKNADGRLELFARGGDGAVWHNWQVTPNGTWSGWDSLGGWIDRLAVGTNADGRLELFARGSDAALWHMWQIAPNSGWSGWDSLGGWIDMIAVSQNADGRMEVFARGSDAALWHMWQTAPSNGWSGWDSLGGWIDMIAVGKNLDGRMEVFVRGSDAAVWHKWQTAPSNGWSDWDSLGGWIDRLAVSHNQDGRIEVFARGGDGAVWHIWQNSPNY